MDRGEEVIVKMPYFQTSGQNMLVNEGSTIKLPCIVNRLEGFVLLWKKGEDFVAVGDRIVNPTDPRLQLIKETNGNTLVISLAEEEDAGEYVCQVSTYKPIEIKRSVQIRVKPEVHPVPNNRNALDKKRTENANWRRQHRGIIINLYRSHSPSFWNLHLLGRQRFWSSFCS